MSEIKDQLNKLNVRVDELETNPSELTKDALLAEVRAFYDAVKNAEVKAVAKAPKAAPVAKEVVAPEPVVEAIPVKEEKKPEPVAVAPKPVAEKPEPVVEVPAPVAEIPEPVAEAPKKVVEEPVAEAKPVVEAPVAEEKPKAKKEPMIGKEEPVSKAADKKILAGQFNQEPLADLRSGIPLNEKFGIIRNLFKGNASDFGDAVLKLNNAANAKEMAHYIELLTQRFEWDNRTEAYQSFMGYVERKMLTLKPSNADADQ
ncbi:MAG: hypothetical protein KBF73_02190 [Flavobacteriales bacterium]|nr:hypothetical protein [Flavobacteriales bacterium]